MTIDEFTRFFPDARKTSKGFSCRCPAHEDRQASLSVSVGDNQPIVLHCHAGCSPEAILRKIGIDAKALCSDASRNGHPKNGRRKKGQTAATPATPATQPDPAETEPDKPRKTFGTELAIRMHIASRLAKEHGSWSGIEIAGCWRYGDTFQILRFNLPTPTGKKQEKTIRPIHCRIENGKEVWRFGYGMNTDLCRSPELTRLCSARLSHYLERRRLLLSK